MSMIRGKYGVVDSRKLIATLTSTFDKSERELLEESLSIGVAPAICVNNGCGYFEELSLSADNCFCPVCFDTSVRSVIFLSSMEGLHLDLYRMSMSELNSLKDQVEYRFVQTQRDEDSSYLGHILQAIEYRNL